MDPNYILVWIVGGTVALQFIGSLRQPTGNIGWLCVYTVVLILLGTGLARAPQVAGYAAGIAWLVLVVLPFVAIQIVHYLSIKKRYHAAVWFARIAAVFHPADGWQHHPALCRALGMAHDGRIDEACDSLEQYRNDHHWFGRLARAYIYRLNHDWQAFIDWFESGKIAGNELDSAIYYIRAIGETGRLNDMVAQFAEMRAGFGRRDGDLRNLCRLFVFAFSGRTETLERLFRTRLAVFPPQVQSYWLATAWLARRNEENARKEYEAIQSSNDRLTQHEGAWRFDNPPAPADGLSAPSLRILDDEELQLDHDERYGFRPSVKRSKAVVTLSLIFVNLLVFSIEMSAGGATDLKTLTTLGAVVPAWVMDGQWWRIAVATFLHYGTLHLMMNMLALLALGPYLEFALGPLRYITTYIAAGFGSMLAIVLLSRLTHSELVPVLGASGGVMGVVGAIAAVYMRGWRRDRAHVAHTQLVLVLLIIIIQMVFDVVTPNVSFLAHFSGALIGFTLASIQRHEFAALNQETQ